MPVLTNRAVIAGQGDDSERDGDLSSLVDSVRLGRPAAVDRLIARVRRRVYEWAATFTRDLDAADDVTQVVLITLERRLRRFSGASRFSTWLYAVTRNVALSHRRRDQRRSILLQKHLDGAEGAAFELLSDPDTARLAGLVLEYFDRLPARQREIFDLADLRGWSTNEIAQELRIEPVTVRAHLFRARRTIREAMLEHHKRLLTEYSS